MDINFTIKEVLLGLIGVVLGGVVVSLFTSNTQLNAELAAIKSMRQPIEEVIKISAEAKTKSNSALNQATKALESAGDANKRADEALKNVEDSELKVKSALTSVQNTESEAKQIVKTIKTTELVKKVDDSISELRIIAKDIAKKEVGLKLKDLSDAMTPQCKWSEWGCRELKCGGKQYVAGMDYKGKTEECFGDDNDFDEPKRRLYCCSF